MKLRCTHNSIRLRLRRSEVERLMEEPIQEAIHLGPAQVLRFSLSQANEQADIKASFSDGHLAVILPMQIADKWINTDQVGIEATIPTGEGEELHLLIEKDFPCTGREGENKADFFGELADGAAC